MDNSSLKNNGAQTDLAALIAARFAARELELFSRRRARAHGAGTRASLFRGRGLEFEEVRHYQAGDELRAIDWRVTARTGVAHTKLFREERERPVLLMVDLRHTMGFGSVRRFKSVAAAEVAALLAWATLHNGDRVGGMVFGDHGHREIRPARNRSSVLQLLHNIHDQCSALATVYKDAGRGEAGQFQQAVLADMLAELRRVARPGAGIFLLSDFAGFDDACARQLHLLCRHCDVNAIRFYDPLETALPDAGLLAFSNGHTRLELDTAANSLRMRFNAEHEAATQKLATSMTRYGVALRSLATPDDAAAQLAQWFHPRASRAPRQASP
ncbi:MAG: DUF58 domain-containing protein [Pseudomonadales bacterium]